MKKPEIDVDSLDELEEMYRNNLGQPPGPEKELELQAIKNIHARLLERADMPIQPISPEGHLLGVLDWGSGIARTIPGEAALAGKAAYDKATTGRTNWTPGAAGERITNALLPAGEPALSAGQYLEQLDVPEMGKLSETWPGQKMGIERGSTFDITGRGALGFGLDMAATPSTLLRGGQKVASGAEQTAKAVREEHKKFIDTMQRQMAPGMQGTGGYVKELAIDPLGTLGKSIYKSRFKEADAAAIKAGKAPVSNVLLENNAKGATSPGVL